MDALLLPALAWALFATRYGAAYHISASFTSNANFILYVPLDGADSKFGGTIVLQVSSWAPRARQGVVGDDDVVCSFGVRSRCLGMSKTARVQVAAYGIYISPNKQNRPSRTKYDRKRYRFQLRFVEDKPSNRWECRFAPQIALLPIPQEFIAQQTRLS